MTTVVDQVRPWLMPSRTLAATTHPQSGAQISMAGMGIASLARTASRYVHRRGSDLLCEETEAIALTWYTPDDIVSLVHDAGFDDVVVGAPPRAATEGQAFSIRAHV